MRENLTESNIYLTQINTVRNWKTYRDNFFIPNYKRKHIFAKKIEV